MASGGPAPAQAVVGGKRYLKKEYLLRKSMLMAYSCILNGESRALDSGRLDSNPHSTLWHLCEPSSILTPFVKSEGSKEEIHLSFSNVVTSRKPLRE